jgi:hypothetical protein
MYRCVGLIPLGRLCIRRAGVEGDGPLQHLCSHRGHIHPTGAHHAGPHGHGHRAVRRAMGELTCHGTLGNVGGPVEAFNPCNSSTVYFLRRPRDVLTPYFNFRNNA